MSPSSPDTKVYPSSPDQKVIRGIEFGAKSEIGNRETDEDSYFAGGKDKSTRLRLAGSALVAREYNQARLSGSVTPDLEVRANALSRNSTEAKNAGEQALNRGIDGLFIVADGAGGEAAGDRASQITVEEVLKNLAQVPNWNNLFPQQWEGSASEEEYRTQCLAKNYHLPQNQQQSPKEIDQQVAHHGQSLTGLQLARIETIRNVVAQANRALFSTAQAEKKSMLSTLTMAVVIGDELYAFNCGDSRTYTQDEQGNLVQLTKDHSLVQALVASGVLDPKDAAFHPQRSFILESIGAKRDLVEELRNISGQLVQRRFHGDTFGPIKLSGQTRLLLCCDGLWENIPDTDELAQTLARKGLTPDQISNLLVQRALDNRASGKTETDDNITAIVADLVTDIPATKELENQLLAAAQKLQDFADTELRKESPRRMSADDLTRLKSDLLRGNVDSKLFLTFTQVRILAWLERMSKIPEAEKAANLETMRGVLDLVKAHQTIRSTTPEQLALIKEKLNT